MPKCTIPFTSKSVRRSWVVTPELSCREQFGIATTYVYQIRSQIEMDTSLYV
jgi:hypothetical protein